LSREKGTELANQVPRDCFGSPVDKIAYLFRIKKNTDELRAAAFSAWQPLIRSYATRPDRWVNIYSWVDLFSGPLHFYVTFRFDVLDAQRWRKCLRHTDVSEHTNPTTYE